MMKYHQGRFQPKHPKKYKGDPSNIIYRSGWELQCMAYFDKNPDIILWSSEEIVIPYLSPIDGKWHRYFPDFLIKTKNDEVYMLEIKPEKQTKEPIPKKRITKQYINEVKTWGINSSKWKYAREFCEKKGWKFDFVTERDLNRG